MPDVIVIGGGVIGLSTACLLAKDGCSVQVVDQGAIGQEASWAGAGMLPPGNPEGAIGWEAWLRSTSARLWSNWALELIEDSGIDIGFRRCGAVEVRPIFESPILDSEISAWQQEHVPVSPLSSQDLQDQFPALQHHQVAGYWLPDYAQVRNPRLLKALAAVCLKRGVTLSPGEGVREFYQQDGRVIGIETQTGRLTAGHYVLCAGAWSQGLARPLNIDLQVAPVRGQMVLLEMNPLPVRSIVQSGLRYIVPRNDGRILVGATEEAAGFLKQNTAEGIAGLIEFGQQLIPALKKARFERAWSGLRPWRAAGVPFIGRCPAVENLLLATGHFRSGLQLSPITAQLIARKILGQSLGLPPLYAETHPELA